MGAEHTTQPLKLSRGIKLPKSPSTVSVTAIDSTSRLAVPVSVLIGPPISGHDRISCPAISFLIKHAATGKHVLFDLGTRKDLSNFSPATVRLITQPSWTVEVDKDVADILGDNGIPPSRIDAVIWSHWHYDHVGNMKTFPSSTDLIVGPGFREALTPGWPVNENSMLLEADWEGRNLVEMDFSSSDIKIGRFRALDFFADGSFYLLDTPGHAIGHMCALARVTSGPGTAAAAADDDDNDTFILLGGDACHHNGEFRPTELLPLPETIHPSPISSMSICPASLFQAIHRDKSATTEFYKLAPKFSHDHHAAVDTIHGLEELDADARVLVLVAHDPALTDGSLDVPLFPAGTLDDWKARGLKERIRWYFLRDFAEAAVHGRQQLQTMGEGMVVKG
ncbi:hypothetical protein AYO21_07976 [Fonsecaea monophora]|uniref:Metallo-beta-lactamase domain-containing protein n=1 Tax=Fonsecaea monophora TaxID=254056 RepID=A0A177F312_9EURO|nr:hypothetical protein AYO21_07976 [Fonsecaea monophora]OAG37870.1 hypothetical protein AYO21_07976 [Fonsecaea monophora]